MTRFLDGPAQGKTLMLGRAPIYLRVTELLGDFDALDQLDDTPNPGETMHAYVLTERAGWCHILRRGKGAKSGFYASGTYRLVETQPDQATMLDTEKWRQWTSQQPRPEFAK